MTDKYKIKPKNSIKILGTYITNNLTWDTEVGKLAANLHNRIYNIDKLKPYTEFKNRLNFMNAYVIGKLRYMLPIYMSATSNNIVKLQPGHNCISCSI